MATILLSAAGAAVGGSIGGTALGLSMVAVGRLVGATLGRAIDQRLLGQGAHAVETGRVDRLRLTGSGEGEAIAQVFGRMRLGGHVIWSSDFRETVTRSGGGKGRPRLTETGYSYSISLAIALCEGPIAGVPRIWADGVEIALRDLNIRVHTGHADQQPDPGIEAVEGTGKVPAYRGTAYVVIEDLALGPFGNRVPQFECEVLRPDPRGADIPDPDPAHLVRAVALMPGSGEYALADTPVSYLHGPGQGRSANINSPSGQPDLITALDRLRIEAPLCRATSLIVSWFGDDLRCADCTIRPKVEQAQVDGNGMPWRVSTLTRTSAPVIARIDDRPVYGGTPADAAVIAAIRRLQAEGQAVMVYPFILMDQLSGNTRPDPWSEATSQPVLPWRGRITATRAPGRAGSPDGTAAATAEVAAFFGTAHAGHFTVTPGQVSYHGPEEWRYNRFILHHAALCAAAGGVDSFCIGSEMRGLTQLRGPDNSFPAVTALCALAAQVRTILGPAVRIGYAADWSEYSGYQPADGSGDRFFHLDPLWSDANIDFIGIDNYMPLSDWRDGRDHADAAARSPYDLAYLRANIEGGEGYDWFYHSPEARAAQIRTPITDSPHDEPWIWRVKDIRNWWQNAHHERVGGQRSATATAWVPRSKPIWFTELGCPAVDRGTNQPNVFLDPKSSESHLPHHSSGQQDEVIQMHYLRAMLSHWRDPANNPVSPLYGAPMLDMARAFVWAWDARPFPFFPANGTLWADAANYARGHWVSGRLAARSLASVVDEICTRAGLTGQDTRQLYGLVRGYVLTQVADARSALQPLMLAFGFDAVDRDGRLHFIMRRDAQPQTVSPDRLALLPDSAPHPQHSRAAEADMAGRIRLRFVQTDTEYTPVAEEAVLPDEATHAVAASEIPLLLSRAEGRQIAERWLAEARLARDSLRLALPPSQLHLGAGDVLQLAGDAGAAQYRIDRVEIGPARLIEAVRVDPAHYQPALLAEEEARATPAFVAPLPVFALFLDLPLMTGDEVPHAPHLAVTADPWPGPVALYAAPAATGFTLNRVIPRRAIIGVTQTALATGQPGLLDRRARVTVRLTAGQLSSIDLPTLLAGGNLAALGDGTPDRWEVLQFASATLIAPQTYDLSLLLRGQLGTDTRMPGVWPAGSYLVLLDGTPAQIDLPAAARGLTRHYRIGPAARSLDDPAFTALEQAFDGIGLRPLAPVHLRARRDGQGGLQITWIRRSRIDADSWDGPDIPLGEETESYVLRILQGQTLRREVTLTSPAWTYTAAMQQEDALQPDWRIEVAQLSARTGPGLRALLTPGG
jgi:hypothetical protein